MERRAAPEVTIEGGPGWQLDAPREALRPEDVAAERATGRRRVGSLVLAAALGFAAATALAEARTTMLAESDDGVLSLEVMADQVEVGGSPVSDGDGRLALSMTVAVRNTGPKSIGLERAELAGTAYSTGDLAGRRVDAGESAALTLLGTVDCSALPATTPPGALQVTATTGAGNRTVDLRVGNADVVGWHAEIARGACGQSPPSEAAVVMEQRTQLVDDRLRLTVDVSNASARPLLLTGLDPVAGLRLVELLDEDGTAVPFPVSLAAGDYDPPVDFFVGRGDPRTLVVVLEVEDCSRLPRVGPDYYLPLVAGTVSDLLGRTGRTDFGGDSQSLLRLVSQASCESTAAPVRGDVGPSLAEISEQALHALRRDHPFLTPD